MTAKEHRTSQTFLTNTEILNDLRRGDQQVWHHFDKRYRPVIVNFAKRAGLGVQDADDAAQEALAAFVDAFRKGKYEREKGRLRHWLFGIARNQILKSQRRKHGVRTVPSESDGTGPLTGAPAADSFEEIWDSEWRGAVLRDCFATCRQKHDDETVRIVEMLTFDKLEVDQVAANLGVTVGKVNSAKHRVLKTLREIRATIEKDF